MNNMKNPTRILLTLAVSLLLNACKDNTKELDTIYPEINMSAATAFPKQCSEVRRGEKFAFRATLSDNVRLGSVSVDIHHNFDGHSHSTEVNGCSLDPVKQPVNPFVLIRSYPIPDGLKTFMIEEAIDVPEQIQTGDYHFLIRLTDHEGWQTIKGLSIRII